MVGIRFFPYAITKITNEDGKLYYQRPPRRKTRRVVEDVYAQTMANMMAGVLEYGTGRGAQVPFPAAGKTGTSQDSRDAWFMGFTDEFVAGVWLGNDDNSPMKKVTGGSYPATIWRTIMVKSRGQYGAFSRNKFDTGGFDHLLDKLLGFSSDESPSWQPSWGQDNVQTSPADSDDRGKHAHERKRYN